MQLHVRPLSKRDQEKVFRQQSCAKIMKVGDGLLAKRMINARLAQPIVSEESISILSNHLRFLLKDFVAPNDDFIGHAFPAGDIPGVVVMQDNELVGEGWMSPVRTFAKSSDQGVSGAGNRKGNATRVGLVTRKTSRVQNYGTAELFACH